jgi:hypothetical protein
MKKPRESGHLLIASVYEGQRNIKLPFCAAHLLASAHSTSRSSSLSDLFPTRIATKCGLAKALASVSHWDIFKKESRLPVKAIRIKAMNEYECTNFVISYTRITPAAPR